MLQAVRTLSGPCLSTSMGPKLPLLLEASYTVVQRMKRSRDITSMVIGSDGTYNMTYCISCNSFLYTAVGGCMYNVYLEEPIQMVYFLMGRMISWLRDRFMKSCEH